MSEQLRPSHEHQGEKINAEAESKHNLERLNKGVEAVELNTPESIEHLNQLAQEQAFSSKEVTVGEHEHTDQRSPLAVQKELKADSYSRTLKKVRQHLNPIERGFSRLIHKPSVETVSNIGAATVGRPSGILGGGIVSLAGSSTLLYMSKHYGFQYNFLVFFLLFLGGFTIGFVAEMLIRYVWRRRYI